MKIRIGGWIASLTLLLLPVSAAQAGLVVVDPEGQPVEGAVVELRTEAVDEGLLARLVAPSAEKATGPEGTVDLALPAVRKLLIVDHPGFALWETELTAEERPERVALAPGRSLPGFVVDGAPGAASPGPSDGSSVHGDGLRFVAGRPRGLEPRQRQGALRASGRRRPLRGPWVAALRRGRDRGADRAGGRLSSRAS